MGVVTALRTTRRGRVAVYVDDAYVCSVSEALLARLRLYQSLWLDDADIRSLREQASAERVLADAHRLLGQRQRSRRELERRLLQKEHTEQAIAAALDRLEADGLLDDTAFAAAFVADKRHLAGWGVERIRRGLADLGVAAETIERALASGDEADELERALAFLRRRQTPQPPLEADRRRAYAALHRRGFAGTVCYEAIRRWVEEHLQEP